ncbi:MAG: metallophosphoesterase family protein [Minisyncoccota bacterium]
MAICPFCNKGFEPKVHNQVYCQPSHRRRAENVRKRIGVGFRPLEQEPLPLPLDVVDVEDTDDLIQQMEEAGFCVTREKPAEAFFKAAPRKEKGRLLLGVVSDTHLGSETQQLTHLHDLYRQFAERGIKTVLHSGDLVDGIHVYKGQEFEVFKNTAMGQRDYAISHYPHVPGIQTILISGNHDFDWVKQGFGDIVEDFASARKDVTYLGYSKAIYETEDGLRILLRHPRGGGGGKTRSLPLQNVLDKVDHKAPPHMVFLGHYHHSLYLPHYKGMSGYMTPCLQSMTPFMNERDMSPDVGGLIWEVFYNEQGITRQVLEEIIYPEASFVDKDF